MRIKRFFENSKTDEILDHFVDLEDSGIAKSISIHQGPKNGFLEYMQQRSYQSAHGNWWNTLMLALDARNIELKSSDLKIITSPHEILSTSLSKYPNIEWILQKICREIICVDIEWGENITEKEINESISNISKRISLFGFKLIQNQIIGKNPTSRLNRNKSSLISIIQEFSL